MRTTTADPLVVRIIAKVRRLAATRPALARLLEWWIDEALKREGGWC